MNINDLGKIGQLMFLLMRLAYAKIRVSTEMTFGYKNGKFSTNEFAKCNMRGLKAA